MEDLEGKLQSILSDPAQMAQVAALAESLGLKPPDRPQETGGQAPEPAAQAEGAGETGSAPPLPGLEGLDLGRLMGRLGTVNGAEQRVLGALRTGLGPQGQARVDRALRAARLSRLAGQLLRSREAGHV